MNQRKKSNLTSSMKRRFGALACVLFILVVFVVPEKSMAEQSDQKIVKVGYVNAINYEEGGEGEYKRGTGYEYLQQISYRTGWKYEYVYGSFKDCYEMLEKGEIDLFGNVSYTPERAESILFSSYPQGKDVYLVSTTKDRRDLISGDIENLNDCKIGVTEGSYQQGLLDQWLSDNQIQAETFGYSGYEALMDALEEGTLDAIVTPDLSISYNLVSVVNIGFSEYYFAVSKSRPDLLKELNEALYEIQNTEKDYNSQLITRYYNRMTSALLLNEKEEQWLKKHNNILRAGYLKDDLPFCGEVNGNLVGVMQTVIETIEKEFGIQVETKSYDNLDAIKQAVKDGEVDVAGPVISDFYLAEEEGRVLTSAVMDSTPVVIYSGEDVQSSLQVIASPKASVFESGIINVMFPDAEVVSYESQEECLEAVESGKAGSTLVLSSRLNILRSNQAMGKLNFAEMAKRIDVCFTASQENRRAATIVNKGIILSYDVLNGVVLSEHSVAEKHISLKEIFTQYSGVILSVAFLIIFIMGILIDRLYVSQKKLVTALDQANSANVAKTTFLSNMSHDMRTPMNAIMGFTDIALKQNQTPQIQNCLEKIEESSDHLLALINDVLDISRIESGKIKYEPMPVNIMEVTNSVLHIMKGFLANRDLEFNVHRGKIDNPYVNADAVRVREVLVNILGNAVKFTKDGGCIDFAVDKCSGKDDEHIVVRYRISDTGIGMSKEFLNHLFDEFTQENSDARTQYRGTGLGMAITKKYVELMGGSIRVESERGVGSTFTVELPFERTDESKIKEQAPTTVNVNLSGIRILLAEDNDLNAEIATVQLEEYGMIVTRAVDGQNAVEQFAANPTGYDVILMDIMMPCMNGYEATRAIRAMTACKEAQQIPIIAMTANAFAEDVQASLDAGMNAHLSKPIVVEELIKTISRNL